MSTRTLNRIGVAVLALACTPSLFAQTPWNRKVEAIAVTPDPATGLSEIVAYYSVADGDVPSAPLDYATDLLIMVNGTLVDQQRFPISISPNDGTSGCAGIGCLTTQACLCCDVGGDIVCFCGGWIAAADPVNVNLRPEDYIEVLLRPAPGGYRT